MKKLNLLVTGIGGGGVGEQVIKALRLSDLEFVLYGADTTTISKGFKEVDQAFVLPPARETAYIPTLLEKCKTLGIQAIFPGSEPELKILSANRDDFAQQGIHLFINPAEVLDICLDKNKTVAFFEQHGLNAPRSVSVKSSEDLSAIDFFPVIIKPAVGAGGSANVMVAQDPGELKMFVTYLLSLGQEFVAQEYVGDPDNEYTAGVLCGADGEVINSIVIRRNIRSGLGFKMRVPNRTGKKELGDQLVVSSGISQGEVIPRSFINEECERIAKILGCTCAVNVQCRVMNGKIYVFEINPRFSGTTSLRAMVGYNEPAVLIRKEILHEKIQPHFDYAHGHIVRGLSEVFIGK